VVGDRVRDLAGDAVIAVVISIPMLLVVALIVIAIASVPYGVRVGWGPWPGGGLLVTLCLVLLVLYFLGFRF
jgi:hypothetical protein